MLARLTLLFALPLLLSTAAQADTLLRFVDSEGEHSEILVKGPYARMDIVNGGSGGAGFMLFNAGDRSLYIVDQTDRSYMAFNEQVIDAQMQAMEQMITDLRAQVQQLPAEQRAEMEAQLGLGVETGPVEVETRATGREQEIAGLRCEEKEIIVGGRVQNVACVASPSELGLSLRDFDTLNALMGRLFDLSRRALDAGGPMAQAVGSSVMPALDGVPLEVRDLRDGVITRLAGISTDTLSPEFFRIPPNYREREPF